MKSDSDVQADLFNGAFEFSRHALQISAERNISSLEIQEAGAAIQIIERYPDDKYTPSCLVLGYTRSGRALHIQVSLIENPLLKIITLYEPDPSEWIDDEIRR